MEKVKAEGGGGRGKGGKGKGGKAAKDKPAKEGKKPSNVVPLNAKAITTRAREGDADAQAVLEKIVLNFEKWRTALAHQKEENRRAGEIEGGALAAFETAVEAGLPTNASQNDIFHKLKDVEEKWQTKKDAEAHAAEIRKSAADKVKKAAGNLARATEDGAQLSMEGKWSQPDAEAEGEGFNADGQTPEDALLEDDNDGGN